MQQTNIQQTQTDLAMVVYKGAGNSLYEDVMRISDLDAVLQDLAKPENEEELRVIIGWQKQYVSIFQRLEHLTSKGKLTIVADTDKQRENNRQAELQMNAVFRFAEELKKRFPNEWADAVVFL